MCGIFGVIGENAAIRTIEGLRCLEYRGYDSSGIAAMMDPSDREVKIETQRSIGYVSNLAKKMDSRFKRSIISIGHTRWATHGGITENNAHPHSSDDGLMSIVHNGIIENTIELSQALIESGYSLKSETDTELIIHLLHNEIGDSRSPESVLQCFDNVIKRLTGSWAIAAIISGINGIFVARNGAPLVIGRCEKCLCISSDPLPLYGCCTEIAYLDDGDIAYVSRDGIHLISESSKLVFKPHEGDYSPEEPGIFSHMMIKEIHDQPVALQNAIAGRIAPSGKEAFLSGFELKPDEMRHLNSINLVACGTAFFAAKLGAKYISRLTDLNAHAFMSSEFDAEKHAGINTLTIGVSQSGETKDTLDALTKARLNGGKVASICNVIDSTIARYTGNGAYLYAGAEYSVASTKAFTNMAAVLLLLSLTISDRPSEEHQSIISGLRKLPNNMQKILNSDYDYNPIVEDLAKSKVALFIGRGPNADIASEAALKMMEVTYLPCLSYPAGELKHGPIALIEEGTPVIAIAPQDSHFQKMEANIRECATRGAKVILVTNKKTPLEDYCAHVIQVPIVDSFLNPFLNIMPLHILSYLLAVRLGRNVDRPRNLAKSVTVI